MVSRFSCIRIKSLFLFMAAFAILIAPLTKTHAQNGETTGGLLGGTIGGVLGQVLGKKGDKTVTTVIGAGLGAFIGSRIGKALSKRDRQTMATATQKAVATGQPQSWTGEKASGSTALVSSERRSSDMAVPVLKDKVTKLPPLDFINANYVAATKANVLGGPGTEYRAVGALKKNDVVTVTGKVQNAPWYLVSQNGIGTGFVAEKALKATTAAPTEVADATGTVENLQTQVKRTCRTVKQTVTIKGKEESENVTACQTANGWEVV